MGREGKWREENLFVKDLIKRLKIRISATKRSVELSREIKLECGEKS